MVQGHLEGMGSYFSLQAQEHFYCAKAKTEHN